MLAEYRSRTLWPPLDAVQVEKLTFGYPDNPFTLEKEGSDWRVAGKSDVMVNQVLNPGAGCRIAQALPGEVMLPSIPGYTPPGVGLKQVFTYTRLTVNSSGLTAGGVTATAYRMPSATISGPSDIRTGWDMPASGKYYLTSTTDLRPPLTITPW